MSPDRPELEKKYRQPRVFGALPGPRNVPLDKRNLPDNMTVVTLAASALTDAALLAELLPPRCRLHGDPVLTVSIAYLRNIGWLAGRGYNIVSVEFPIVSDGEEKRLTGKFTPVLWENLADPIVTGREELGFAKLYAQIPEPIILGNAYRASASWEGFRFFELEASDLADAPLKTDAHALDGAFHYRFMPRVGAQGEADAEYMAFIPGANSGPGANGVTKRLAGNGVFRFLPARWEDMPTQYPIINALAELPLREFRGASVTFSTATGSIVAVSAARGRCDRNGEEQMSGVRRIVTGHRDDGKAIIKSDSVIEPQPVPSGDAAFAKLWVTQTSPADNTDARDGAALPSGLTCMDGSVLRIVDMQPGKASPMHKTNSVDYGIVLSGEIEMRLDSGEATRLKAGDIVVQRGTNHAWANVGKGVARMAFVLIDALPLGDGNGVTP